LLIDIRFGSSKHQNDLSVREPAITTQSDT